MDVEERLGGLARTPVTTHPPGCDRPMQEKCSFCRTPPITATASQKSTALFAASICKSHSWTRVEVSCGG
jgi:hypothetical protein